MNAPLQKGRLGKGLASLIGETQPNNSNLPVEGEQRLVATDQLSPSPLNPRRTFRDAELKELADSIEAKGLVQPIIVRRDIEKPGCYEIVAGERRWRAAQKARLHSVPVIVRDLTDKEVLELAIIENVQRADLNAMEEAAGYRELLDRFAYSQEQVSEIIGKSRSHVANTLRLLKLPPSVQDMVREGKLSAGHARPLIGHPEAEKLARRIVEQDLNAREAEALTSKSGKSGAARTKREKDADTRAFEKELADLLGLQVEIKRGSGESGTLTIKYGNFDQLDYIRLRLTNMPGA